MIQERDHEQKKKKKPQVFPEARKDKETDFPATLQREPALQYFAFSIIRLILDFRSPEM